MLTRNLIAIDLAKDVFQVCITNQSGNTTSNKPLKRKELKSLLINTKPTLIAFEGCGSAHYWGRLAEEHGHTIKIIAPKKVTPYRQGHKTDKTDAQAIALAAQHNEIRSCPLKSIEQQTLQSMDSTRTFLIKQIRASQNHIRALVYEYGLTIKKGRTNLFKTVQEVLEEADNGFPLCLRVMLSELLELVRQQEEKLKVIEKEKRALASTIEPCQRLTAIEAIGPVGASKLYTALGDGRSFKNGREAAAYLGATPKQHSSGGKVVILGIDKKNMQKDLISTLYQGALSVICRLPEKPNTVKQQWLINLVQRVGRKRACIALVNKNIRTAWALLSSGQEYQSPLIQN